jgi:hypothetical protein
MLDTFKEKCPQATVIVSSILDRRDIWYLSKKVTHVNGELEKLCNNKGVDFLDHSFLAHREGWLAKDKLHLNPRGNAILGNSFRASIRDALNA